MALLATRSVGMTYSCDHTRKKNAIAPEEVLGLPNESRMVIIIMQKARQAHPIIMVFRRPILSSANAGSVLPICYRGINGSAQSSAQKSKTWTYPNTHDEHQFNETRDQLRCVRACSDIFDQNSRHVYKGTTPSATHYQEGLAWRLTVDDQIDSNLPCQYFMAKTEKIENLTRPFGS